MPGPTSGQSGVDGIGNRAELRGQSLYTARPDDPKAVSPIGIKGDGVADDTHALQNAIDTVQSTHKQGVVFLPEGRYRISKTLYVWPGVRLLGYGAQRPVLLLGPNTPGFQDPEEPAFMVFFTGQRPKASEAAHPPPFRRSARHKLNLGHPWDAHPGTFYSATLARPAPNSEDPARKERR
jgi:hypothetical protein